jgi:hypothetical protein
LRKQLESCRRKISIVAKRINVKEKKKRRRKWNGNVKERKENGRALLGNKKIIL